MKIQIRSGDIAEVGVTALITAINSGGLWFGGIDDAIRRVAGAFFHQQALRAMPLRDGQTVIARGDQQHTAFQNVVFVVDDLKRPLRHIVKTGLAVASDAGFDTVSLPTLRTGVMPGVVEETKEEAAVIEMAIGVREFFNEFPHNRITSATFVVYNDWALERLLSRAMMAVLFGGPHSTPTLSDIR